MSATLAKQFERFAESFKASARRQDDGTSAHVRAANWSSLITEVDDDAVTICDASSFAFSLLAVVARPIVARGEAAVSQVLSWPAVA